MWFDKWLDTQGVFLGSPTPLPLTEPFTSVFAQSAGISGRQLGELVGAGLIRRVCRGVYVASQVDDSMESRCAALGLIIGPSSVVTDRTAGWLHGMPVLKRGAHLSAPPIEVCQTIDSRSTRGMLDGHRRMLLARDVDELHGLRVTTPMRTCLDLGRLTWRYDALAALDSGLRLGIHLAAMREEALRFKGFRGVRQLRSLLEIADGASESPGESALRLHWYEVGLPAPELQIWLRRGGRDLYRLDLGSSRVSYAAEYDGEKDHTEECDRRHDQERRKVIADEFGWELDVFEREIYHDLVGTQNRLQAGYARAVRRPARWVA